ncbi:MAG: sugar phosphate isomerase/epimerase family protein [Candidatus Thorarchaeota archaeon]
MVRLSLSIVSNLNESKNNKEAIIKKFESICELIKPLNYDGIELSLLEPEKVEIGEILEVCDSYNLKIPALGTGSTYIRLGYSFGDSQELIRKKAIERVSKYIDFAQKSHSKVIIGLIRGRFKCDSNPSKERMNIISSLKECCQMAANQDVQLVFEPINSFEIDSFNTISQSRELLEEIGSDHLKLLIDSFHTYLEEDPIYVWEELKEVIPLVHHVHLADTTRRAPGSGHFDFKSFLRLFKASDYSGFVSLETIMKPSFEEVAKTSSYYLKSIL